jgi:hypothetical protein
MAATLLAYHRSTAGMEPDPEWKAKLEGASTKFQELGRKAVEAVRTPGAAGAAADATAGAGTAPTGDAAGATAGAATSGGSMVAPSTGDDAAEDAGSAGAAAVRPGG